MSLIKRNIIKTIDPLSKSFYTQDLDFHFHYKVWFAYHVWNLSNIVSFRQLITCLSKKNMNISIDISIFCMYKNVWFVFIYQISKIMIYKTEQEFSM